MGLLHKYSLHEWYRSMGCLFLPVPSLLHRTSEYAQYRRFPEMLCKVQYESEYRRMDYICPQFYFRSDP